MILLVWTVYDNKSSEDVTQTQDHYEAFESLAEAKKRYEYLISLDDTYSASICSIIESTDYDLKEVEQ